MTSSSKQSALELQAGRAGMFWRHAFAIQGSVTPHVLPNVCIMGVFAGITCLIAWLLLRYANVQIGLTVAPYELFGAALGLLLVLRTNGGYERWWEARKLWGGIVNQCRNLAVDAATYGPNNPRWQADFLTWIAVFPYCCMANLRGEKPSTPIIRLLGEEETNRLATAGHMPMTVAAKLGMMLKEAREQEDLDGFFFLQLDRERAILMEHIGSCERIKNTPLPLAYSIKIRRFIATFLITLPFALIHDIGNSLLVPLITMLVAYPLFALDQLGVELQNPFDNENLSHLPLEDISATIERNTAQILAPKKPISVQ